METEIETEIIQEPKRKSKTGIIIILLLIVLFAAGCYIADIKYFEPIAQNRILDAKEEGAFIIINQINANGNIPVINNAGNITWTPIKQICAAQP